MQTSLSITAPSGTWINHRYPYEIALGWISEFKLDVLGAMMALCFRVVNCQYIAHALLLS
jgi:hypothetical protein